VKGRRRAPLSLLLLGILVACAGEAARPASTAATETTQASCPRSRAAACEGPSPTYARDILPILERRCAACHAGDGPAADEHDFSRFATIHAQRDTVADEIATCAMPPRSRPPLPEDEASVILQWVACGGVER
jgi:hypothetical protein